jgi:peroxiredoxin
MAAKLTFAILAVVGCLLALGIYQRGFSSAKDGPRDIARENLFKHLNIEPFDKKAAAPDFTLKNAGGGTVTLHDLKGKVVFLNFWATWCPSCNLEMPAMERLQEELGGHGLVILAVNLQETSHDIEAFLKRHKLTFTILLDPNSEVFQIYRAWSLPTTFVIDKHGEMIGRIIGYRDWDSDSTRALFRKLLEDKSRES